jgi:myo-inositol catabolism protein IolC
LKSQNSVIMAKTYELTIKKDIKTCVFYISTDGDEVRFRGCKKLQTLTNEESTIHRSLLLEILICFVGLLSSFFTCMCPRNEEDDEDMYEEGEWFDMQVMDNNGVKKRIVSESGYYGLDINGMSRVQVYSDANFKLHI